MRQDNNPLVTANCVAARHGGRHPGADRQHQPGRGQRDGQAGHRGRQPRHLPRPGPRHLHEPGDTNTLHCQQTGHFARHGALHGVFLSKVKLYYFSEEEF